MGKPKGRILGAKLGYNPNSSSVGSLVSVLMWSAAAGAFAFNVLAAVAQRSMTPQGIGSEDGADHVGIDGPMPAPEQDSEGSE